jgi:hypothetical protein
VVAIHEADAFGLGAAFENLVPAAEFQIFDEDDLIAVRKHIAVGILNDTRSGCGLLLRFAVPFVTTGDTFKIVSVFQNIFHRAHRAGGFTHKEDRVSERSARHNAHFLIYKTIRMCEVMELKFSYHSP